MSYTSTTPSLPALAQSLRERNGRASDEAATIDDGAGTGSIVGRQPVQQLPFLEREHRLHLADRSRHSASLVQGRRWSSAPGCSPGTDAGRVEGATTDCSNPRTRCITPSCSRGEPSRCNSARFERSSSSRSKPATPCSRRRKAGSTQPHARAATRRQPDRETGSTGPPRPPRGSRRARQKMLRGRMNWVYGAIGALKAPGTLLPMPNSVTHSRRSPNAALISRSSLRSPERPKSVQEVEPLVVLAGKATRTGS